MILLIDNYDSFAHNLARYFRQLGCVVLVERNDALTLPEVEALSPEAIVISPGPCTPDESGICLDLVKHLGNRIPLLGICLGHQAICQSFGGKIVRIRPVHGQASLVTHTGHPVFANIDRQFLAGRYHSLVVKPETMPGELEVIAKSDDEVMAVCHRQHPVVGLQFHPESILTPTGYQLIANFLDLAGLDYSSERLARLSLQLREQCRSTIAGVNDEKSPVTPHPSTIHPELPARG